MGPAWTMAPPYILAVSTVINIISLLVNLPHIVILYSMPAEKYLGARNNRLMLLHIATMDIITTGIRLPLDNDLMQMLQEKHFWFCALTAMLGYAPHLLTHLILVIGCIDRLIAVRHPTSYTQWFLPKHIAWFYWIPYVYYIGMFTAFTVVYEKQLLMPRGFTMCLYNTRVVKKFTIVLLAGVIVPMMIIFALYGSLIITVCKRQTVSARGEAGYAAQAAKIIVVIVMTHFLLWICAPLNALIMGITGNALPALWYLGPLLVACNSATHPPIYGLMNSK